MANVRYHVIYGGEIGGKLDGTHVPVLVTAADVVGTDGASRPSPDNIIAAITAAGLHNKKSTVTHRLYSVATLDDKTVATQA